MIFGNVSEAGLRAMLVAALAWSALPGDAVAQGHEDGAAPPRGPEVVVPLASWSPLIKRVMPSVVNVSAEIPAEAAEGGDDGGPPQSPFDEFLRRYFQERGLAQAPAPALPPGAKPHGGATVTTLGSAFVIDPAGYIVTNNHVVAHATSITVILQDNSRHRARVVGTDRKTDIAVLKISVKRKLRALEWGDSNRVEVGDWVMTVGNPFGLGGTVTTGIVSALGRDLGQGPFDDFLQIDAPINRGNSGGPAFDNTGRVIGINTAIYSPTGGSVGIGFAIPSNIAKVIVQRLRDTGHASHGYLGFSVQLISPEMARALRMDPDKPHGVLVSDVVADGPAAKAGLQLGDVIEAADGRPVREAHDLAKLIVTARIGEVLHVSLDREGRQSSADLVIAQAPSGEEPAAAAQAPADDADEAMGVWFAGLTPDLRRQLHLPASVQGVAIGGVQGDSAAAGIGLVPGDVVLSIDRQPVGQPADAMQKLKAAAQTGDVLLLVNRRGSNQFVVLPAQGDGAKN